MSALVLGLDGGGTGCRAVLVDGEGHERARVVGEAAVADGDPGGPAVQEVVRLARAALEQAGIEPPVDALWAGLAGAGRASAREGVARGIRAAGVARRVAVGTDVEAAFQDAFGRDPGILLVAGTGSVAQGRSREGTEGRAGGWGPILGDEGSAWSLGVQALRAAAQAVDGRGPATRLTRDLARVLELDVAEADELPHHLLAWFVDSSRSRVAALAPLVVEAAGHGDAVATALVDRTVQELVRHVTALEARLGPWADEPRVALAGGLLEPGRPLSESVARALQSAGFGVLPGSPDAALGAAALARRLATAD